MNKINTINYITYQTFPANTANSLQTISNIKYLLKNNMEINLIFPLRESGSSDSMEKINEIFFSTINEKSLDEIFNKTLFHFTM